MKLHFSPPRLILKSNIEHAGRINLTKIERTRLEAMARSRTLDAGVSESTVGRIWKRTGLKPHRVVGFKISKDPKVEEKLVDVVALYLDLPEHAIVLSVDEKSQIQALDRTHPSLPIKKGRCGTMTYD